MMESTGMEIDRTEEELYPIAILIDELKHEDLSFRLNAITNLPTIALALGEERTRSELIPFLDESIDDDDEILLSLAEKLGEFVNYIGGPSYAHILLRPLENLAATEEQVVRDKAKSINKITDVMSEESVEQYLIPCIARLSQGEWFTSRSSAAGLYANAYKKSSSETQQQLLAGYERLCEDETPMARRAAATHLVKLIPNAPEYLETFSIKCFKKLAHDDQDSVRLLAVEPFIAIGQILVEKKAWKNLSGKKELFGEIIKLCQDKSWRVKYMAADKFIKATSDIASFQKQLILVAERLLSDTEAEVRGAACTQIVGLLELVSKQEDSDIKQFLIPIKGLADDSIPHVRSALAKHITGLCSIFGRESTMGELLPIFISLLKDQDPEVRLNLISSLGKVTEGIETISHSLLPAIIELAEDKQWRVRLAIIEYVPLLAQQLGVDFFNDKLVTLCMSWLGDPVYSVREAATANLKKLIDVFGIGWAKETIIPKILATSNHPNYLYRMTTVFAFKAIAPSITAQVVQDLILPCLEALTNDPIPNIRFNVAKCMWELVEKPKQSDESSQIQESFKTLLHKLEEDLDQDVRFFASDSLSKIENWQSSKNMMPLENE
ncbi:protein phosphatase 2A structural subunit [Mycoemilia scoparia]|uniref:Protein phosphatase 2A structural subunit n=1 Tax=Mycoemilia scoparia TaxID=417184 RepID=A0A9W8DML4_9FUNG|nr:protein phosphatase 2A structural subunit [Mycoemilia scoparia]